MSIVKFHGEQVCLIIMLENSDNVYLRNEFNFSEVHEGMNRSGSGVCKLC